MKSDSYEQGGKVALWFSHITMVGHPCIAIVSSRRVGWVSDGLNHGTLVADIFEAAKRSEIMSRIRGRDTKPEMVVRKVAHRLGFRFRLHRRDLPGCPDLVFPRYRAVIMVHGCFWHRHPSCQYAYSPKTRVQFWQDKFESNMVRDRRNETALKELGWRVLVIWECETKDFEAVAERIKVHLRVPDGSPANRTR